MKSEITIKKIQEFLLEGMHTSFVDDDTSRRMWWASLEVIQKEFLSQNLNEGGVWVASPLPALNEKKFYSKLQGWLLAPKGFPYFKKSNIDNTKFGPFTFNQKSLNLYKNDVPVHLTTSEQKLLCCFCESPNKPFSRDDINNSLGANMETRSIDVAIARIRRKIEEDQKYPIYLQTVRGVGWMLQTHEND